ncbi:CHAT domain-containing protein [Micromonospora sp. NPDC049523]|uniref:CHAT domain-containing protein n=1 Tax=Micromonospora sp. NPDC049523 TaxID=3155921 RepID=UPI0034334553
MPVSEEREDPVAWAIELIGRYREQRDLAAIARAEELLRQVPGDAPERPYALLTLCEVIVLRVRDSAPGASLDHAVELARAAVDLVPADSPLRPLTRSQLCWALCQRYEATGQLADLDEALAAGTAASTGTTPDHPNRAGALRNLGYARRLRYSRFGQLADLDEAVRLTKEAVATVDEPVGLFVSQSLLTICLIARFAALGRMADVDEAVELCRLILAGMSADHVERVLVQANLSYALWQRHMRGGPAADLEEATRTSREVITMLPTYPRLRSQFLANHAVVLFGHFLKGDSGIHVEAAVQAAREAVEGASTDDPRLAIHRSNLANMVLVRARLGSDPAGVEEAVRIGRVALSGLSPGNPDRTRALSVLATAFRVRSMITGATADLDSAVGLWRAAVGSRIGPIEVKMAAATAWATAATDVGDAKLALEAYSVAVGLLPVLAWRGLERSVQEQRLAKSAGLGADAAAWALAAGQPRRAVELLEHGRQVLWSQAVQTRSDLSALAAAAPELAARLDETRRALDGEGAAWSTGAPDTGDPGTRFELLTMASGAGSATVGEADRLRRLAERWERLLAEARSQPGFEEFLAAPRFETLRRAADHGPVIMVSTTRWRSDALVITPTEVHPVPLPWLDHDTVQSRAGALLAAQREAESGSGALARTHLRQTLISIQRWLWDTLAEPVCAALDEILGPAPTGIGPAQQDGPTGRRRVWWCPTGPLTMLPLHAAGRYGAGRALRERRRPTVTARLVSSYTSGLGALLRARSGPAPARPARVFAVGLAQTPGQAPLPAVADELRAVSENLPGVRLLSGPGATTSAVLAALGQHSWAHFACHARQDFDHPSASALHLSDGRLSVLDLSSSPALAARSGAGATAGADLAYLSACRTAAGGRDLPDEAIHLTAALQLAGYRHVIGSQWAVSDRVAAQVAEAVYAHLTAGGEPDASGAAYALDRAVARVREEQPDRPELWAPLVHTGP